ncbi:ABC transporter ATP-binding protein [Micromonospora sp. WMMD1082]|uniref:ABC transporter ATP-binding protein n=1 Tax=Micromonospora sp. WMMD1082 TaxID=3016104 RepID=UPI002415B100|nr:ABC transporter ATP-binding protein [Micromonospora sp. WMMD1082]MDG4792762.1 ABC transporter ATP-binding protein [Micromonospora sp. WMMD1082]
MTVALEVRDLVKRYPKARVNAVDGISFTADAGEIFGLLGPNGAGKSTTIGVLTTRARATSGHVVVGGVDACRDPVGARRVLATVPQHTNVDRSLTPRRNLLFHAAYHGVPSRVRKARAAELLDAFGLAERANARIETLSGGMVRRLMIARALMHQPRVLFLDEPTTGLDPQSRLFLWDRVRELRQHGVTVVLTTHAMEEAADLADRVGIMDRGRLLALDTPAGLTRSLAERAVLDLSVVLNGTGDAPAVLAALTTVAGVARGEWVASEPAPSATVSANGTRRLRLHLDTEPAAALAPLVAVLDRRHVRLSEVHVGQASLEDVFIELTGRGLR